MRSIGRVLAGAMVLAALGSGAVADPAPDLQPTAPATSEGEGQATLSLSATIPGVGAPLKGGVHWRVFSAKTEEDGSHTLVADSEQPEPALKLPPGDYVVHAALGLASATKPLKVGPGPQSEKLTIPAGGLKIGGVLGDAPIDPSKLSLAIYVPVGRNPEGKLVYAKAKAGEIVGLPEGAYHVVSTFLDTVGGRFLVNAPAPSGKSAAPAPPATLPSNSVVTADIRVTSGKLTDVTLRHRCALLTLKLVNKSGGDALPNTTFTVLTPGGDVIRELMGAFPSLVLSEGEYAVVARHDGKTYQSTFQVETAMDRDVEIVAQDNGRPADDDAAKAGGKDGD